MGILECKARSLNLNLRARPKAVPKPKEPGQGSYHLSCLPEGLIVAWF